jgi:hypothetical protein
MAVLTLDRNQVGKVAETAAARFLEQNFSLESLVEHAINAHGVDHHLLTPGQQLVIGETKGTAGVGPASRRSLPALVGQHQASPEWIDQDAVLREAGVDASMTGGTVGCHVNLMTQTIVLWERNADGGWDRIGAYHCPVADLVESPEQ